MTKALVGFVPAVSAVFVTQQESKNPWAWNRMQGFEHNPFDTIPVGASQLFNPYASQPPRPPGMESPQSPVAPMDKISGVSPVVLPPQITGPAVWQEGDVPTLNPPSSVSQIVANPDRLAPVSNVLGTEWNYDTREWYPPQAPPNYLPPEMLPPNHMMDLVKGGGMSEMDRAWFAESGRKEDTRELFDSIIKEFQKIDSSSDGLLQWEEFKGWMMDTLGRSEISAGTLFARLKRDISAEIDRSTFIDEAANGFLLNIPEGLLDEKVDAKGFPVQLTHLKPVYAGMPLGYWSDWALCPKGQVALAARLESQPYAKGIDNAGVVAVGLVCGLANTTLTAVDGVNEISNIRSGIADNLNQPAGSEYTDYNFCRGNTAISGVRLQSQPYQANKDNAAFTNVQFECSAAGVQEGMNLLFGNENTPLPQGIPSPGEEGSDELVSAVSMAAQGPGVWSPIVMRCGPTDAVCGLRTRFRRATDHFDDMGVTDAEFICCPAE